METNGPIKHKRNIFVDSDVQLLLDCVNRQSKVLENKKTNGITFDAKRKAWDAVIKSFNARQVGGPRKLNELQNKYKNEKKLAKKMLSSNATGIPKRSEESDELVEDGNTFGFSNLKELEEFSAEQHDDGDEDWMMNDDDLTLTSTSALADSSMAGIPPYQSNSKITTMLATMRGGGKEEILFELKVKGFRLDNENKKKTGEKLDLEKRKLELEVERMERELFPVR